MDWLEEFKQTIDVSARRLRQMSEAEAAQPRAEDHWSSKQIVGHLIDSAANNHARFVLGQLQDNLVFPGYDQNGWVKTNHYQESPWAQLIDLWRAYNLHLHHLMSHADSARLNTPCTQHSLEEIAFKAVPQSTPVTLEYLMKDYVDHLKHHLNQIFSPNEA
jgi:hypothetical protein